jgi:hypothetical protein
MPLAAYFDESDRKDGSEPICVAGYVFSPGGYRRFAREWRRFLRSACPGGLRYLHMTDLYAGLGAGYRGLGDHRAAILGQAVALINEHIAAGVGTMFDQAEFVDAAPPWYAELQGSIYSTACQICLRQTAVWLEDHGCSQLVTYTFEAGHKFEHEANAILRRVAAAPRVQDTHRYHSHRFAEKTAAAGLQAADVLAWTLARARIGFPDNRTMDLFAPHVMALARDSSRYQVNVFTAHTLRRFFAEQADKPKDYYFRKPPEFRGKLR